MDTRVQENTEKQSRCRNPFFIYFVFVTWNKASAFMVASRLYREA